MRKYMLAALSLCVCLGLTIAGEVGFVKFDKEAKKVTVMEDGKEKTYKITENTKFMRGDKDVPADKALMAFEKMKEGKGKLEITTDGSDLKEVKMPAGKKKN